MLSPTLLHNLCSRDHPQIVIRMSPYGTRDPGIPTARSIELARVASPFSIHRCHEALLIDALHEYFRSSKRLVKGGDIIPLRINVDSSLDPRHALCSGDFTGSFRHNRSDVPVYFVVRSVDYVPLTVQTHGLPFPSQEVGCFVDSTLTRIIQVGVEYVRVPDVYDYYQLGLLSFLLFLLRLPLTLPAQVMHGWRGQRLLDSLIRSLSYRMQCRSMKQQAWECGLRFLSRGREEQASSQRQCTLPVFFRCITWRSAVSCLFGVLPSR